MGGRRRGERATCARVRFRTIAQSMAKSDAPPPPLLQLATRSKLHSFALTCANSSRAQEEPREESSKLRANERRGCREIGRRRRGGAPCCVSGRVLVRRGGLKRTNGTRRRAPIIEGGAAGRKRHSAAKSRPCKREASCAYSAASREQLQRPQAQPNKIICDQPLGSARRVMIGRRRGRRRARRAAAVAATAPQVESLKV